MLTEWKYIKILSTVAISFNIKGDLNFILKIAITYINMT